MASESSRPKPTPRSLKGTKRPRVAIGSDSSIENELSYLDLDTGNISTNRAKLVDQFSLHADEVDSLFSKIKLLNKA